MSISSTLRNRVMMLDNFTCVYCGYRGADVTVDHFIPESLGGPDIEQNLVAACGLCNSRKADRAPYEARMTPRYGRFAFIKPIAVPPKPGNEKYIPRNIGATADPNDVPYDERERIKAAAAQFPSRRKVCAALYGTMGGQKYRWVQTVCDAADLLPVQGVAQ
jgi:hypothetical protein